MKMFQCAGRLPFFWFRIFGVGLVFKDMRKFPPLFSERNGYKKALWIGWLSIKYLPRTITK